MVPNKQAKFLLRFIPWHEPNQPEQSRALSVVSVIFILQKRLTGAKATVPSHRHIAPLKLSGVEFKRLYLSLSSFRLFLFSFHGRFIVVLPFLHLPEKTLFLESGFERFQSPFNVVSLYLYLQVLLSPSSFRPSAGAAAASLGTAEPTASAPVAKTLVSRLLGSCLRDRESPFHKGLTI